MRTAYKVVVTWLDGTVTWSKAFNTRYAARKHLDAMHNVALVRSAVLWVGPEASR